MMRFSSAEDSEMRTLDIFINNAEESPNEFVSRFTTLTKAKKASLVDEILCASTLTDECGNIGNNSRQCGNVSQINTEFISKELRNSEDLKVFMETNTLNMMRSADIDVFHELSSCINDGASDIEADKQTIANDSIECIDLAGVEDINTGNLALCFSSTDAKMFPTTFDNFFNDCNSTKTGGQTVCTELLVGITLSKSPLSSLPSLDDFIAIESEQKVISKASQNLYSDLCALASETLPFSDECRMEAAMHTKIDEKSLNSQDSRASRCESEENFDLLFPGLSRDENHLPETMDEVAEVRRIEFTPCVLSEKWHEKLKGVIIEPDDCVHPFSLNVDSDYH